MALHFQMKTHPSSKTRNAHCHDIKKNLLGVSAFICVLSPSTQASKERTCVPFLDLIWGIQHTLQRDERVKASLICYTIFMLEIMIMESSKEWTYTSGQTHKNMSRDFKRQVKKLQTKETEDSLGGGSCAYPQIQSFCMESMQPYSTSSHFW